MFWKKKKKEDISVEDIPLPPSKEELPTFPSPKKVEEKIKPEEAEKAEEKHTTIIKKQKKELKGLGEHKVKKPLFLKVNAYKGIVEELSHVKSKLNEATNFINDLEGLEADEKAALSDWQKQMKDVQEKLIYVDETIFKKGER